MTTNAQRLPLITRFASKLREGREKLFRYDPERQVSQVWNGEQWVDSAKTCRSVVLDTTTTAVGQETTDDN